MHRVIELGYSGPLAGALGGTFDSGSAQRQKLLAEVIDMARRWTDKDLQAAVQVIAAVTSVKTRIMGKA